MTKPLRAHTFDRADDEWYVEPIWCSNALFKAEGFNGGIWDPACGQGNILASAFEAGHRVLVGSDIVRRAPFSCRAGQIQEDFFKCVHLLGKNIITNPPSGRAVLAEKFIRHALALRPAKLAVFIDIRFLLGSGRARGLFFDLPPSRIWFLTPRPSCPPGRYLLAGNKANGGTADYCWLVWDQREVSDVDVAHRVAVADWLRGSP